MALRMDGWPGGFYIHDFDAMEIGGWMAMACTARLLLYRLNHPVSRLWVFVFSCTLVESPCGQHQYFSYFLLSGQPCYRAGSSLVM